MSEKDQACDDSFDKIIPDAFSLLYHAIMRRDKSKVTPEVMRVAKALCVVNGGDISTLVQGGKPLFNAPNETDHRVFLGMITMAWTPYVGMATCAIANLEAHREENSTLPGRDDHIAEIESSQDAR